MLVLGANIVNVFFILQIGFIVGLSEYKVKITLQQYVNRRNLLNDGRHCESFHFFDDGCDPRFEVQILDGNNIIRNYVSKTFGNKNYIREIDSFYVEGKIFPENFLVKVKIWDIDNHRQERILEMTKTVHMKDRLIKIVEFSDQYASVILNFNLVYHYKPKITTPMPATEQQRILTAVQYSPLIKDYRKMTVVILKKNVGVQHQKSEVTGNVNYLGIFVSIVAIVILCFGLVVVFRKYKQIKRRSDAIVNDLNNDPTDLVFNNKSVLPSKPLCDYSKNDDNIYENYD